MRIAWALVTCGVIGVFGLAVMTAEKPPDEYSKAMKGISAGAQNLTKAIQAEDFDVVETNAGPIVDAFSVIEKYWTGKAVMDAMKLAQTAKKAASDLRVAAGQKSSEGVVYAMKELTDTCMPCHTAHREQLPDGSFQIK